jgi:hypothetical protein
MGVSNFVLRFKYSFVFEDPVDDLLTLAAKFV